MMPLAISFDGLHSILRDLYMQMMKMLSPIMLYACAIAGLGAIFFIGYRIWQSIARAEPIDVFALLRPFVLCILIVGFDTMVLGTINGIFSPFVEGTGKMMQSMKYDVREVQKQKDKVKREAEFHDIMTVGGFIEDEEMEAMLESIGWGEEEYSILQEMYSVYRYISLDQITMRILRRVLEFLFQCASLVIDVIRTFFLIVLSLLGPIAFAISVFDGFHNTLTQWLSRYISVYLWLPVSDLLGTMLMKMQSMVIERDIHNTTHGINLLSSDGTTTVYVIIIVIGIIGYFCIPTVANWIVQAGGMGAYNRNVNQAAMKATNTAGAAAGAASGNVGAVLIKK